MPETTYQDIPLTDLIPNPANPRSIRTRGAHASIAELARSIRALGVLQPLVVTRNGDGFHILAGERRFKAARRAGLDVVPCVVRDSGDEDQVVTIAENLQRVQLHPLQEAEGIARLVDDGQSAADVAAVLGVSEALVSRRLQLRHLAAKLRRLYLADESPIAGWSVRMLELAASYPKGDQEQLVQRVGSFGFKPPANVRELRAELERSGLELTKAPWEGEDEDLDAPACVGCSENTATHASLFADLAPEPARCLNRECFDVKRRAWLLRRFEAAQAKHGEALVVVAAQQARTDALPAFGQNVLSRSAGWRVARKKDEGSVPAFVAVEGWDGSPKSGALIWIQWPEASEATAGEGRGAAAPDSIEAKLARSEELLRRKRLRHAVPALVEAAREAKTPAAAKLLRLVAIFGGAGKQDFRSGHRSYLSDAAQALAPQATVVWEAFTAPEDEAAMRETLWRCVQRVIAARLDVGPTFDDFDVVEAECAAYAALCGLSWSTFCEAAREAHPPSKALVKRRGIVAASAEVVA